MSESKEENPDFLPKSKPQEEHGFAMDFDIGLESLWPLDHISSVSNPMSPFLLSTIEQPFSPVWAFSDVEDEKQIRIAIAGIILCLPRFPILLFFVLVSFSLDVELDFGVVFNFHDMIHLKLTLT